ncbi:MAG TPA: OpgC domain-containing protein [Opitutaceae bacterium]|jgi:hypothetical protein|nr:OpgC domain-containing protein [Opitutaceae bacterium]
MPSSGRDLRFDSLRGLMLVMMTVNHLPSVLSVATDEPLGICSSAEGFVFLSGLLAGLVYTRRLRREGRDNLWAAARKRSTMIWQWQVGSILGALICVQLVAVFFGFCSEKAPQLFYAHPWLSVLMGGAMLYQPGMLDILPMYCVFVAGLPIVLEQLEAGRRWWVLGVSCLLWLTVQNVYGSAIDGAPLYPLHVGSFNLFAWQFIFYCGVVIGHAKSSATEPLIPFRPWLLLLILAVAVYGWGIQHRGWVPPWSQVFFGVAINKTALGFFRLTNFGCIAYLLAFIGRLAPRALTWRPLAFLGQHSIAVFGVQSVVGIVLLEFWWLFATPLRNWITSLCAIGALWITAAVHQAVQNRAAARRGRDAGAGPSAIGARQSAAAALAPRNDVRAA